MIALVLLAACLPQGSDELLGELAGFDRVAQRSAVEALASSLDHPDPRGEIAAALARVSGENDDPALRRASLDALGGRGDRDSIACLAELARSLPPAEQVWAVRSLGATPAGRSRAWELLVSALEGDAVGMPLAELVRVGSRSLAEGVGRARTSAELSPFARLLRSPDPAVGESVILAVEALVSVLEQTSGRRAMSFLEALKEAGYRAELVADHVCDIGLLLGETGPVIEAARVLSEGVLLEEDALSQARGLGYLATAHFIAGEYEIAEERFVEQRAAAEALSRRPLAGRADLELRSVAAQLAATAEVGLALNRLAQGAAAGDAQVLEAARRAHVLALRSQALGALAGGGAYGSLEFLFGTHPAPWRALEGPRALPGLERDEAMRWRRELLAAFASVAPEELPGITPLALEGVARTSEDPERLGLVYEIHDALVQGLRARLAEARRRESALYARGETDAELDAELQRLAVELRSLRSQRDWSVEELLPSMRRPSNVALSLAVQLREEGRLREARSLLESFLKDVGAGNLLRRYAWAIRSAARAETILGSCFSDEDEGKEAERSFLRAVQRLEDLESHFASRGISPASYRDVTSMRAGTLISLAVNANVRLQEPERALAFFERAYELRKDSFATVLLACYRARSGLEQEARVALARIVPEPVLYYNLACTHALLGDTVRALSFLELELSVNHTTRGARGRQRAWARDDPDLRSLRDDPRFEELTRER